jgi:hypothetical protein
MKFRLEENVLFTRKPGVWTIKEIREIPGDETKYWLQLATDFATRTQETWAIASELVKT